MIAFWLSGVAQVSCLIAGVVVDGVRQPLLAVIAGVVVDGVAVTAGNFVDGVTTG